MEERSLGNTGLKVPMLGWGTVKIGRNTGVKYPAAFELPTDEEVDQLVGTALELGVRLFDTAPAYGDSEERLGRALVGRREDVILCTKVGEEFDGERSHHAFDAAALRHSVERSLRRLRTDRLDILLVHSDGRDREILEQDDVVDTLAELRRAGLARAVGISAKTAEGIRLAKESLDVVMAPLSSADPALERPLQEAAGAGCGILAIKVFAQGHALGDSRTIAEQLGWITARPFVSCAIAGSRNPQHLREWVRALSGASTRPIEPPMT